MNMIFFITVILASCGIVTSQYLSCPLLGPDFPPPTNLHDDPSILSASQSLTEQLNVLISSNSTSLDPTTSFSVQWFSAGNNQSLFEYHYTGASVAGSSNGVKEITADSIYRVGSISKLYTVYLFLIEAGHEYLSRSIVDFVPELAQVAESSAGINDVDAVQWGDITIGSLASHMAGIGRDDGQKDLLAADVPWTSLGFPELSGSQLPSCGFNTSVPACNRTLFFQDLIKKKPVFAPFTTPIYSNNAFALIAFALESITNKTFADMIDNLFTRLNVTSTFYTTPATDSMGAIPFNTTYSGWSIDIAALSPAGSIYASTKDLSSLGQSILNNLLLNPAATRRWMKPQTFTSSSTLAVGAPWEIFRVKLNNSNDRITDYYTKGGDLGVYSSLIGLISDYKVGFSILTADGNAATVAAELADMTTKLLGPALEQSAQLQAKSAYTGTYTSSNNTNSSLSISIDEKFGLSIDTWISNGSDMFANIKLTQGIVSPGVKVLARLVPTELESKDERKAFRAVFGLESSGGGSIFDLSCATWTTVDALNYGGVSLDLFVFQPGKVEIPALQIVLQILET